MEDKEMAKMIASTVRNGGVMKRGLPWIVLLLTAGIAFQAKAGRYELIKGQRVEVCEAYLKNLNSLKPNDPMLCERSINPDLKIFTKPAWVELTQDEIAIVHAELADQISSLITRDRPASKVPISERVQKAKESIAANFNDSWPLSMRRASIDIDNNGKTDIVAKEIHGKCDRLPYPVVLLRPIGRDALSSKFTKIINTAQHRNKDVQVEVSSGRTVTLAGQENLGAYMFPDVFRYKSEWYLDILATESNTLNRGNLYVSKTKDNMTTEICQFRIVGDK